MVGMPLLLLLFIAVPAVELALLIEVGQRLGTVPTLGLIVATGVLGAGLARHQGLAVLGRVRAETAAGRVPAGCRVDGLLIQIAGAVLMTPGLLTDLLGFALLIPPVRSAVKSALRRRFEVHVIPGTPWEGAVRSEPRDVNPRPD
jgi:UPF0716 protein FxsA